MYDNENCEERARKSHQQRSRTCFWVMSFLCFFLWLMTIPSLDAFWGLSLGDYTDATPLAQFSRFSASFQLFSMENQKVESFKVCKADVLFGWLAVSGLRYELHREGWHQSGPPVQKAIEVCEIPWVPLPQTTESGKPRVTPFLEWILTVSLYISISVWVQTYEYIWMRHHEKTWTQTQMPLWILWMTWPCSVVGKPVAKVVPASLWSSICSLLEPLLSGNCGWGNGPKGGNHHTLDGTRYLMTPLMILVIWSCMDDGRMRWVLREHQTMLDEICFFCWAIKSPMQPGSTLRWLGIDFLDFCRGWFYMTIHDCKWLGIETACPGHCPTSRWSCSYLTAESGDSMLDSFAAHHPLLSTMLVLLHPSLNWASLKDFVWDSFVAPR